MPKDNTNDGNGDCCESHITSLTSINSRKRKNNLLDYENDNQINIKDKMKCVQFLLENKTNDYRSV